MHYIGPEDPVGDGNREFEGKSSTGYTGLVPGQF